MHLHPQNPVDFVYSWPSMASMAHPLYLIGCYRSQLFVDAACGHSRSVATLNLLQFPGNGITKQLKWSII
jgi:hypothetical protein